VTPDARVRAAQKLAYDTNDPQAWADLYVLLQRYSFVDGIAGQTALFEEWIPVLAVLGDPGAKLLAAHKGDPYDVVFPDDPDWPGHSMVRDLKGFFHYGRRGDRYDGYCGAYGEVFEVLVALAWIRALVPLTAGPVPAAEAARRRVTADFARGVMRPLVEYVQNGGRGRGPHDWVEMRERAAVWQEQPTPGGPAGYLIHWIGTAILSEGLSEAALPLLGPRVAAGARRPQSLIPGQVALTLVKPWVLAGSPRRWDPTPYLERDDFWPVRLP